MKQLNLLLLGLVLMCFVGNSFSQEKAPLKTFEFAISINKLKTEVQAERIKEAVKQIPGVRDVELILIEYVLTFDCTNHDMNEYLIIDRVKTIILENGSEIVTINKREK